jgi:hypothetical protein
MADNALPVQPPAPNDTPPAPTPPAPSSEPAPKPADGQPAGNPTLTLDSFSDEEKKYLQSQGVTDLSSPEAIKKIINHAQSSQKTAADIKNQLDKVKGTLNPEPMPTNPLVNPTASSQPQPDGTPTPAAPQGGIDPVTALNLATSLAISFPELKDDLTSGKLYKDMQAMGIPLHQANGQVNLDGILKYGSFAQQQAQAAAKLEELNKPGEGAIPDANPTAPAQPAADAPMTKQIALAIGAHVAKGGSHPRADEAKQFLQSNIGK